MVSICLERHALVDLPGTVHCSVPGANGSSASRTLVSATSRAIIQGPTAIPTPAWKGLPLAHFRQGEDVNNLHHLGGLEHAPKHAGQHRR